MSSTNTLQLVSQTPEATEAMGEAIGRALRGGEVIELASDLGGGKTTFVRGLARGFGSNDRVSSPTFTISKLYKNGHRQLHHFDFYRLTDAGLMNHELLEVAGQPDCVVVVEWAGLVQDVLPQNRLEITLERTGNTQRSIKLQYPASLAYLVAGIKEAA